MFPVGVTTEKTEVLPPLNQQTNEQLAELAQGMLEQVATDNPKGTTAGITFFGQFIDHDLTLDNEPQPTDTVDVEGLVNGRSFAFDLDSVYGGGPKKSPQLYDGDKFLIGTATDGVSPDLPRNSDGSAILVEHVTTRTSSSPRFTCRSSGCTTHSSTKGCPSIRLVRRW